MNFKYRFPAVRGIQSNREYYTAMVPLGMLSKLFSSDDDYVAPEYRAQRRINEARIPIITKYILDNRDSYVFSALAASIDGQFKYLPSEVDSNIGVLEVDMDSVFLINDGQHRKTAIIEALKEDDSLKNETISIVFYADLGLERSQQIFTDLNKNAVKTSNSISELYDSRDQLAVITRNVVRRNAFLNTYTDKEKDNLGKFSSNLFTLNVFYHSNMNMVGKNPSSSDEQFVQRFWDTVTENMIQWQELAAREITKRDLRENYLSTQGVVIQALGKVGKTFRQDTNVDLFSALSKLKMINWHRNADCWLQRAVNGNGRIITNKRAVQLIANHIKCSIGIPLSKEEQNLEDSLAKQMRGIYGGDYKG